MRLFTVISIVVLAVLQSGFSQGIEFFHGTWEEAIQLAEEEEKVIFVDAFTTWCGPCKRMAAEVFPNEAVGKFYNRHFINLKLDMERGEGLEFRKTYPVSAFPTLFFIDAAGKVVQKVRGAQNVDNFLRLGEKTLSLADNSEQYAAEYEKGNRDPQLIYKYVKALNKAGKSSLRIANEYLDGEEDFSTDFNLRFILEAATEADSKIFSLLADNRSRIEAIAGKEAVRQRIGDACQATVRKAIEFQSGELLRDAQEKMKKHCPEEAEAFELRSEMDFAMETNDGKTFAKASKKYAKKILDEEPEALYKLSNEMMKHFSNDEDALKQAEEFAGQAARSGEKYTYYLSYAHVLNLNGKTEEAHEAARQALEMARSEGPAAVMMVESFIQRMEG